MWKTWIQSLGWEDPLEKGMATHSSNVAWRIPMDRGAWWATVHRVAKSRTRLSDYAQTSCFKCTVERFSGDLPSHTTTSLPYSFRTFPFPQKGPLDVFLWLSRELSLWTTCLYTHFLDDLIWSLHFKYQIYINESQIYIPTLNLSPELQTHLLNI